MDEAKSSILVSGKDGYIYLTEADKQYDLSSPWGTVNLTSKSVNVDVFGRIMAYVGDGVYDLTAEVRVWDPSRMPSTERAACVLHNLMMYTHHVLT